MRQRRKQIGLAVVGCATIGRIRAEFARDYPGIGWRRMLRPPTDPATRS